MWKIIKPAVVPVLLLAAEYAALKKGWLEDELLIGFVFGITSAWAIAAALSSGGDLVRRYPWVRPWLPFLDERGQYATDPELRATYVRGKTFRLVDVAVGEMVVGKTFEDCVILGPAVLAPSGFTIVIDPKIKGRKAGGFVWPLDPASKPGEFRPRDGAVTCEDCRFVNCTFDGVGIANPPERVLKGMTDGESGKPLTPEMFSGKDPS